VITTAELGKIFVERGIKLNELPESEFDCLIGEGTGGAVLFGTTGGVMEAALRTVYEQVRWLLSTEADTAGQRPLFSTSCASGAADGVRHKCWLCCSPWMLAHN
jgi:iron only hydrogenase large subunit-like protein